MLFTCVCVGEHVPKNCLNTWSKKNITEREKEDSTTCQERSERDVEVVCYDVQTKQTVGNHRDAI